MTLTSTCFPHNRTATWNIGSDISHFCSKMTSIRLMILSITMV